MEKNAFFTGFEKRIFEKRSYDSDHETRTHYGFGGNRSISRKGAFHIQEDLAKAAKDPHLTVAIYGPKGGASSDDPEKFSAMLSEIRQATGPRPKTPNNTMDWHRKYDWHVSARKDNPLFAVKKDEKDEWDNPQTVHGKITGYIRSNYRL